MKKITALLFAFLLSSFSHSSQALTEPEAENLADLTAVLFFLKNNCGFQSLPDAQIKRAIVLFAQQNNWDLSNYNAYNMQKLGEESYNDLKGIAIPTEVKCRNLSKGTTGLMAYAN